MRSLKRVPALIGIPFGLAFSAYATIAHASVQTITTSVTSDSITGNSDPGNLQGPTATSRTDQSIQYKIEGLSQYFTLSGSMIQSQPNYSNYLIQQSDGTEVPLSSLPEGQLGTEYSSALDLAWNSGPHSANVGWRGNLSPSPFGIQSFKVGYSEGFFEKTTILGTKLSYYQLHQPESDYIDVDFVTRARPTLLHGNDASIYLDQVLTERWKAGIELSSGIREEDRPRNVGGALKQSYAWTDRLFSQLALTHIAELTSEPLKDERGYFTLNAAEITLTVEPIVDFLISTSYGYVVEDESDPRTSREVQVGSDQYGLGIKYRRGPWGVEVKSAYRQTNTDLQDLSLGGNFVWQI